MQSFLPPRRRFLTGATATSAAGAATLGFSNNVKAQGPITMEWQSTRPAKVVFHEYAQDCAKKINDMIGGDLKIEVLPAGAVVPVFGLLDAVTRGTLDDGHAVLVYHKGPVRLSAWTRGKCCPGTNTAAARNRWPSCTPRSGPTLCRSPMVRCLPSHLAGSRSRSPKSAI